MWREPPPCRTAIPGSNPPALSDGDSPGAVVAIVRTNRCRNRAIPSLVPGADPHGGARVR